MDFLLPFLTADFMGKPAWVWLTFVGIVIALLAFDLGVLHKDDKEIGVRESLLLSAGYISVALLFGAWVWWYLGAQSGMDYYTGFMIEKSLSMDNVFVIALIFSFFAIPRQYQHRVLFWGILGVIVLRAIMIGLGATLVSQFSWVLYLFGAFLIFTGIKMWIIADHMPDIANNPLLKFLKRHMRVTDGLRGNAFWVREPDPDHGQAGALRDAAVPGPGAGGVRRPDLRGRLGAGHLRDHHRPVHRLHEQHLRHPGPARAVLRAGGDDPPLQVPEVRAGPGAGVHRQRRSSWSASSARSRR